MPAPVIKRVWQYTLNQWAQQGGSPNFSASQRCLYGIVNALVTAPLNPWVCLGSGITFPAAICTGGLDGVNRWAGPANIVWSDGNFGAWIVLKQPKIAPNFQILLTVGTSDAGQVNCWVSFSAGFTGGVTSGGPPSSSDRLHRPTATDEWLPNGAVLSLPNGFSFGYGYHVWQSADGEITRVMIGANGTVQDFWSFEKIRNPVAGMTFPVLVGVHKSAGISNTLIISEATANKIFTRVGATSITGAYGAGTYSGGTGGVLVSQNHINDFSGNWPVQPLAAEGNNGAGGLGHWGEVSDLWIVPPTFALGDYAIVASGVKKFMMFGCYMLPWESAASLVTGSSSDFHGEATGTTIAGTLRPIEEAGVAPSYDIAPPPPDTTAPVFSNLSPANHSQLGPTDAVAFDVTDNLSDLLVGTLPIFVSFDGGATWPEVVHTGFMFSPRYLPLSSRTPIANGYHYSLKRTGGWPPNLGADMLQFDRRAVDGDGNEA